MKKEYIIAIVVFILIALIGLCGVVVFGLYFFFGVSSINPQTMPNQNTCVLQTCHGFDNIQCGPNQVLMCTEMYQVGDKCLQYAQCGIVNGQCGQIKNAKFDACKSCVQTCINKGGSDAEKVFECESACE